MTSSSRLSAAVLESAPHGGSAARGLPRGPRMAATAPDGAHSFWFASSSRDALSLAFVPVAGSPFFPEPSVTAAGGMVRHVGPSRLV